MEKITLNGKRYIALGDLERLRHNHIRDIIDKYEKDENGTIHMTEFDRGAFNALAHLMVCILEEEYHENAPDKAKCDKMIDDLRKEQFTQRWCIAGRDPDTHEQLYFRKWCPYVPKDENDDDGEDTPVMSTLKRDGKLYGDYYKAVVDLEILKRKFGNMNLRIWPGTYLSGDAERRLLEAIFGKDEEEPEGSWCIWLEPITEDELPLIEEIEFTFDDLEPQSYEPASIYNATLGKFLVPMSQEQSFWMGHGTTTLDCRVQFRGGDVVGVKSKSRIRVREANSYEVI